MKYIIFKYLWLFAVLPKMMQLPLLAIVFVLIVREEKQSSLFAYDFKSDVYLIILLVCNAIHVFSIMVNGITGQYPLARLLAAGNTISIAYLGMGFYLFYSRIKIDLTKVGKYMFVNLNILVALCALYFIIGDRGDIPLLGSLSGWDQVQGEDTTRFIAYLDYPNMIVFMYLYCYAFAVDYLSRRINKFFLLGIEVLYILPMAAARSRTGVVCGLGMLTVSILLTPNDMITAIYLKYKRKIWTYGAICVVLCGIVLWKELMAVLEQFLSYRAGSTATRSIIYGASLEKMLTESPIWGCGIKGIIPEVGLPYGSPSTYLGMFYKTGILGGSLYLVATVIAVFRIIRRQEYTKLDILLSFAFLALFAFAMLEDIDGANWNAVMFMSLFALCFKNKNPVNTDIRCK